MEEEIDRVWFLYLLSKVFHEEQLFATLLISMHGQKEGLDKCLQHGLITKEEFEELNEDI